MYITAHTGFYGQEFIDLVESEAAEVEDVEGNIDYQQGSSNQTDDVRRSKLRFLHTPQIRDILWDYASRVNAERYGFDIWNVCELQYTQYHAEYEGHCDWHPDEFIFKGGKRSKARKLSMTIQLSDSDDYEGGNFEMRDIDIPEELRQKGSVLLFPSYDWHRVTPVTKGVRKSLVAWFSGPDWR